MLLEDAEIELAVREPVVGGFAVPFGGERISAPPSLGLLALTARLCIDLTLPLSAAA